MEDELDIRDYNSRSNLWIGFGFDSSSIIIVGAYKFGFARVAIPISLPCLYFIGSNGRIDTIKVERSWTVIATEQVSPIPTAIALIFVYQGIAFAAVVIDTGTAALGHDYDDYSDGDSTDLCRV